MFQVAVLGRWFRNLTVEERSAAVASLSPAAARRPVVVVGEQTDDPGLGSTFGWKAVSELPPLQDGGVWVVVGATQSDRTDTVPLAVGDEVRQPGVAWVKEIVRLEHLVKAAAGSGLDLCLSDRSPDEHAKGIRALFAGELERLAESRKAYVFGARRLGSDVGRGLRGMGASVAGYLDNNPQSWGVHADGAPVKGVDGSLDRSLPVIIGTTRFPYTLTRQLKNAGFGFVIPYPVMSMVDPALFPVEIPYIGTYEDIATNRAKYLSEYLNYSDDRSRVILDALLRYRLTLDSSCLQGHFEAESEQYFDSDLVKLGPTDVFVDAGGFDGATTLNFLKRAGADSAKVYYFEPDPALMAKSRTALSSMANIDFQEAGAFSRDGQATFSVTGTTNGSLNGAAGAAEEGMTIKVRKIDGVVKEPPTFIKMDIEGAEPDALIGAREQIAAYAPKLAIAAYHKGEDIWRLAELIRDLNPSYRLGLRHYTEGGLETVIYAYTDAG